MIDVHATGRPIDPDALFDGLFERLASLVPDEDQRLVLATMYARRVADGLRLLGAYDLRRAARPPA